MTTVVDLPETVRAVPDLETWRPHFSITRITDISKLQVHSMRLLYYNLVQNDILSKSKVENIINHASARVK